MFSCTYMVMQIRSEENKIKIKRERKKKKKEGRKEMVNTRFNQIKKYLNKKLRNFCIDKFLY